MNLNGTIIGRTGSLLRSCKNSLRRPSKCAAGLKVGDLAKKISLPTLGPQIKRLVDEVENGRGVALLKGFPVGEMLKTARLAYWGFGFTPEMSFQNSKGQLLAEVSDRATPTVTEIHADFLPMRSPTARRYVDMTTLLCIRPARTGGESRVHRLTAVYNAILRDAPEHLGVLYRGFQNDLREEGPTRASTN